MKGGGWQEFIKAVLFREATGESTIRETVPWSMTTKVWIPTGQALVLGIAVFLLFCGAWLVLGVFTPALQAGAAWAWLALALAMSLLAPGLLLGIHLTRALRDQYWNVGRLERAVIPHIADLFGVEEDDIEPGRLIPLSSGNQRGATSSEQGTQINPRDERMISFLRRACMVGLARRHWLGKRVDGVFYTRDVFDETMDDLARWGIVDLGGSGKAAVWAERPEDAMARLEAAASERMGDHGGV